MNAESVGAGANDAGFGLPEVGEDIPIPGGSDKTRLGALCIQGSDCESGFCVEGVCCESKCDGKCVSCTTSSAAGRCVPADVGSDPRNDCADDGASSCGTDGTCDGSGGCRRYPAGTVCRSPMCSGSTLTPASRCDGAGMCGSTAEQSCAPFRCGDGKCNTSCAGDGDCVAPAACVAGVCGKKPIGAACTAPEQCNSTSCQQGVCCETACVGACRSCAVPGSLGSCTKVPVSMNALCPETCSATMACVAPAVCGGGFCGGLRAQYFNAVNLTVPRLARTDATIDFNWGDNLPPDVTIDKDTWSVSWQGSVVPRYSESYTFYTVGDDGIRLWVDGRLLIDDWVDHAPVEKSGTITLVAGQTYTIRMEYYNNTGGAVARLLWSSATEPKAAIPTSNLRP